MKPLLDTGSISSSVRENASSLVKLGVMMAMVGLIYGSDLAVVFSKALVFSAGNISNYVLVIPVLVLVVLHRKRKILAATATRENAFSRSLRIDDVIGGALCGIAVIVFIIGSTTLYTMEYHLISLPVFVAGATMLLFNIATFRHAFMAMVLLAYLQPPPAEVLAEMAADLSWSSAVLVQHMLSAIGLPIGLDASFGAPALVMQDASGSQVPFYVGEPSSGTYSIVGLSVFSIFVAYILRGKLWKRALIVVIGFPVFYLLNALRIALIISIWYTSGEAAAESFHVVSGTVMSAAGTIVLLFFADLVLRLGMRGPLRKDVGCPSCEKSLASGESHCLLCGRRLGRRRMKLNSQMAGRMVLLGLVAGLVVAAQVAAIENTSARSTSNLTLYNLNISNIKGPETPSYFFPQIPGYDLSYSFRDTKVESILSQDASLAYRYVANTTTANGGRVAVNVGLQISRTLHTWEGSLVIYPSKFGRPTATVVDIGWIDVTDDAKGRFFAYKKPGQNTTEAVLYWTDKRELRFDSGIESRNVQIILHVNMDYLTRVGAIQSTTDTEGTKALLISLARPIMAYWDQISISSASARTVDAVLTRRPYVPIGITVGLAAIFALAVLSRNYSHYKANRRLYEQVKTGDEKLILDAMSHAGKGLTGEAILEREPGLSAGGWAGQRFADMLSQIRKSGLIRSKIRSDYDEPVLVWEANFSSGGRTRRRRLGGLLSQ